MVSLGGNGAIQALGFRVKAAPSQGDFAPVLLSPVHAGFTQPGQGQGQWRRDTLRAASAEERGIDLGNCHVMFFVLLTAACIHQLQLETGI